MDSQPLVEIDGTNYVLTPELSPNSCDGCAFQRDAGETGCDHPGYPRCSTNKNIFVKHEPAAQTPNDTQVGGDHYRNQGIQPWDFIAANKLDWFQGTIIKYVTRWNSKGGVQDLEKARHVLDKYLSLAKSQPAEAQA